MRKVFFSLFLCYIFLFFGCEKKETKNNNANKKEFSSNLELSQNVNEYEESIQKCEDFGKKLQKEELDFKPDEENNKIEDLEDSYLSSIDDLEEKMQKFIAKKYSYFIRLNKKELFEIVQNCQNKEFLPEDANSLKEKLKIDQEIQECKRASIVRSFLYDYLNKLLQNPNLSLDERKKIQQERFLMFKNKENYEKIYQEYKDDFDENLTKFAIKMDEGL